MEKKILIVDDDPINLKLFKIIDEKNNINYDYAIDGLAARDLIKKNEYDLILLDIALPGLNGFEIMNFIKTLEKKPKIIAVTAHTMDGDEEKILKAGADEYMSKPINVQILVDKINKYLK
jgi:DNA-binding response OmpR family regulator